MKSNMNLVIARLLYCERTALPDQCEFRSRSVHVDQEARRGPPATKGPTCAKSIVTEASGQSLER
jgi:hypothetical protein